MYFNKKTKTKQPESSDHAYNYVLFLLNLRFRTEGEIHFKMTERGYTVEVINEIVERLKKERLIDDDRYAENYIESTKNHKFYGYYMIKKKMMERKLSSSLIETKLDELFDVDDESLIAKRFLKSEFGEFVKQALDQSEKEKMGRKLRTRGFRMDVISKLIF